MQAISPITIASSHETGKLHIKHLKRYWEKSILKRNGKVPHNAFTDEWRIDATLLATLCLGLEQTIQYLFQYAPGFDEFEDWVLETIGKTDRDKIAQFNALLSEGNYFNNDLSEDKLLIEEDWAFWRQNGYLIIKDAVSKVDCEETIQALCDFIGVDRYNASTWYNEHPARQGIMVQLFQHPAMEKNRKAWKIKKAYEELWNRIDLWVNADRVGFNPPQTENYQFQGPRLHWDVSVSLPIQFGTQGILYLADTAANQGAFTLVPGFQNKIEDWLAGLPAGADPYKQDLYALGPVPIAANAGDFIIWHHILPHGSSPNTATLPRFVQYINYAPIDENKSEVW